VPETAPFYICCVAITLLVAFMATITSRHADERQVDARRKKRR
jgi:hypothetical protein